MVFMKIVQKEICLSKGIGDLQHLIKIDRAARLPTLAAVYYKLWHNNGD